jgi:hypothetical protein
MYTDWVYSNTVVPIHPSIRSLIKLYLIGDFLDAVRLRIKVMELLVASVKTFATFPRVSDITLIWENTTANSLLRSWMLDLVAKYYDREAFAMHAASFPADFVLQVTLRLLPEPSVYVGPPFDVDASKYLEVEVVD